MSTEATTEQKETVWVWRNIGYENARAGTSDPLWTESQEWVMHNNGQFIIFRDTPLSRLLSNFVPEPGFKQQLSILHSPGRTVIERVGEPIRGKAVE